MTGSPVASATEDLLNQAPALPLLFDNTRSWRKIKPLDKGLAQMVAQQLAQREQDDLQRRLLEVVRGARD